MSFFSPEAVKARSAAAKKALDSAAAAKKKAAAVVKKSLSEEQHENIGDVVTLIANEQYADATGIVDELLNQRVVRALDEYKQNVAKNLFMPSLPENKEVK